MRFAAVVLAAGKSQRMGRNKLLLEVSGRSIMDHVLDSLERSVVDEKVVVLGHKPEELRSIVETHEAKFVLNLSYEEGMTSSIKAGLRVVQADAAFIVLGDQLGLDVELLSLMAESMSSDPKALIVSPVYQGRRGHPILIRKGLFKEILSLGAKETLRDVVARHEDAQRLVKGSVWSTIDVDTPDEFERAKKLFESGRDVS